MKTTYTTFQPTTIVYPVNDDAINGDSSTYISIKDEGAGCFLAINQAGYSYGIMITVEDWPVIRTEINRMIAQIEQLEKNQQITLAQERTGLTDAWNLSMRNAGGTD